MQVVAVGTGHAETWRKRARPNYDRALSGSCRLWRGHSTSRRRLRHPTTRPELPSNEVSVGWDHQTYPDRGIRGSTGCGNHLCCAPGSSSTPIRVLDRGKSVRGKARNGVSGVVLRPIPLVPAASKRLRVLQAVGASCLALQPNSVCLGSCRLPIPGGQRSTDVGLSAGILAAGPDNQRTPFSSLR
jgi:hypothetical protein